MGKSERNYLRRQGGKESAPEGPFRASEDGVGRRAEGEGRPPDVLAGEEAEGWPPDVLGGPAIGGSCRTGHHLTRLANHTRRGIAKYAVLGGGAQITQILLILRNKRVTNAHALRERA